MLKMTLQLSSENFTKKGILVFFSLEYKADVIILQFLILMY